MALINRAGQEISAKVVYYGPGLCGKTTNLEALFKEVAEDRRGKMISMKTRTDRTLFFDLLPMNADPIHDFQVRILLYTVPGQVYYNATRRLVLKGVDALVFVADSQRDKMDENVESLENLRQNLDDMGISLDDLPLVLQYNKRDLPDVATIEELEASLNPRGIPWFESVATRGEGVHETLRGVAGLLRPMLEKQIEEEMGLCAREAPAKPAPEVHAEAPPAVAAPEAPAVTASEVPAAMAPPAAPEASPAPPAVAVPANAGPTPPPGSGLAEVDLDELPEPLVVDLPMAGEADGSEADGGEADGGTALPGAKMEEPEADIATPATGESLVVEAAPAAGWDAPAPPEPVPADADEAAPPEASVEPPSTPPAADPAPPAGDAPAAAPPAPTTGEASLAESLPPSSDASDTPTMVEAKLLLSPTGQMPEIQVRLPRRLLDSGELRLRLLISEEKELSSAESAREPELLRAE